MVMNSYSSTLNGVFPSVCSLDCPDQCGLLVHKKDGKIVKIEGDPNHPVTQGNICNKVRNMPSRIYDRNRLKYPMKRAGTKGEGHFVRIGWKEAIDTITSKWKELIAENGPESILPYSFYGNMGRLNAEGMDRRFFHKLGAYPSLTEPFANLPVQQDIRTPWEEALGLIQKIPSIQSSLFYGALMQSARTCIK